MVDVSHYEEIKQGSNHEKMNVFKKHKPYNALGNGHLLVCGYVMKHI